MKIDTSGGGNEGSANKPTGSPFARLAADAPKTSSSRNPGKSAILCYVRSWRIGCRTWASLRSLRCTWKSRHARCRCFLCAADKLDSGTWKLRAAHPLRSCGSRRRHMSQVAMPFQFLPPRTRFTAYPRADSGHVAAYPACAKNLAQASADNRRTNCPMRRRSASQKPNCQPRTPHFRAHWESRFNPNGNRSNPELPALEQEPRSR